MKRLQINLCLAGLTVMLSPSGDARPISYPGGWTIMQMNDGEKSSAHIHYSPTVRDSIGVYTERNWANDFQFTGLQYNRLLKRWNGDHSQANIYFKSAGGIADPFGAEQVKAAGFLGLAADWETRRYFTSYEVRAWDLGFTQEVRHTARAGIAPYVGNYGDLHTWLMVEIENNPKAGDPVTVTPLIRFFKGVQLVEIGYTPADEAFKLNWIVRY